MKYIVLYNENAIDTRVTVRILQGGLPQVMVKSANQFCDLQAILQQQETHMIIMDMDRLDLYHCNMVAEIKKMMPDTPILLTSSSDARQVAGHAWRLGVDDYLLKPYRPTWLLAAAQAMTAYETAPKTSTTQTYTVQFLEQMEESLRAFGYKKCVDIAKEYLDILAQKADTISDIRVQAVAFVEGLVQMCEPLNLSAQWKLQGVLEHFNARFDLQGKKYEVFLICEKILDITFESLEGSKFYEVNSEQKILNYIDRRIKRGISLDEASEYANMSSCYFSKMFKKITGEKFITYVTDSKIEVAQQMLLNTDLPVINIAYDLSYSETNYFSKAFKRKVGITPTEYRENSLQTTAKCS